LSKRPECWNWGKHRGSQSMNLKKARRRTFWVMQVTNFQRAKRDNWGSKSSVTQMPLIGYFVSQSKTRAIGLFFRRGEPLYPLSWNVANPTILQKAEAVLAFFRRIWTRCSELRRIILPSQSWHCSSSSSKRRARSIACGWLKISEFANERPLLLLGSRSKNAMFRAFLRMKEVWLRSMGARVLILTAIS